MYYRNKNLKPRPETKQALETLMGSINKSEKINLEVEKTIFEDAFLFPYMQQLSQHQIIHKFTTKKQCNIANGYVTQDLNESLKKIQKVPLLQVEKVSSKMTAVLSGQQLKSGLMTLRECQIQSPKIGILKRQGSKTSKSANNVFECLSKLPQNNSSSQNLDEPRSQNTSRDCFTSAVKSLNNSSPQTTEITKKDLKIVIRNKITEICQNIYENDRKYQLIECLSKQQQENEKISSQPSGDISNIKKQQYLIKRSASSPLTNFLMKKRSSKQLQAHIVKESILGDSSTLSGRTFLKVKKYTPPLIIEQQKEDSCLILSATSSVSSRVKKEGPQTIPDKQFEYQERSNRQQVKFADQEFFSSQRSRSQSAQNVREHFTLTNSSQQTSQDFITPRNRYGTKQQRQLYSATKSSNQLPLEVITEPIAKEEDSEYYATDDHSSLLEESCVEQKAHDKAFLHDGSSYKFVSFDLSQAFSSSSAQLNQHTTNNTSSNTHNMEANTTASMIVMTQDIKELEPELQAYHKTFRNNGGLFGAIIGQSTKYQKLRPRKTQDQKKERPLCLYPDFPNEEVDERLKELQKRAKKFSKQKTQTTKVRRSSTSFEFE